MLKTIAVNILDFQLLGVENINPILNEGASKGILVTTSDYGADSYEFAKDKPLTLLNRSNLLHMLQKHRYEARIDLKEAKIEKNNLK
ncbi:restriction endonuclease [Clostridium nigeriense]|uniref:restriction endonuclease n=1 Tax=Clostridium nigeriense TaxID=1805470 RepID=UPI00082C8008|nr:restriction endonuclease [Clostridium nigeriense]